jgi:hypothetical protein
METLALRLADVGISLYTLGMDRVESTASNSFPHVESTHCLAMALVLPRVYEAVA